MMLLAIDTSTAQMGVALSDGDLIAAESAWNSQQHHTVDLAPAVAELLRNTGVGLQDVQGLVVAIGPGSFTALRVGLALAKGLAVARSIPLVGIPTLDVLAAAQSGTTLPLAAVLQAGRGRVAVGWYRPVNAKGKGRFIAVGAGDGGWEAQGEPEITTVDALAKSIDRPTLVAGELSSEERQRLARKKVNVLLAPPHLCVRRPSILAEIGRVRHARRQVDDLAALAPIYVHAGDAIQA